MNRSLTESELLALLGKPMFGDPLGPWHDWFAWHPVWTVDGRFAWLRRVLRRRFATKPHLSGPYGEWFAYARGDRYVV